jgi:hypothetical protein
VDIKVKQCAQLNQKKNWGATHNKILRYFSSKILYIDFTHNGFSYFKNNNYDKQNHISYNILAGATESILGFDIFVAFLIPIFGYLAKLGGTKKTKLSEILQKYRDF